MAPVTILTYNVRGLANRHRRLRAKQFLGSLHHRPDILCLQEHKLRAGRLQRLEWEVWKGASWYVAPATDGRHAQRNDNVTAGLGGLAVAVSPRLTPYVTAHGICCAGRAIWICIDNEKFGRLGFLGIYAPNSSGERAALWRELSTCIDSSHRWIVGGDFNMIEATSDQIGGLGTTIAGSERRAWQHLARHLQLEDTFQHQSGHLRFSWDNRRRYRHTPN